MTTNPEPVGPMSGDGDVGGSAIVGFRIHVERVVTHLGLDDLIAVWIAQQLKSTMK